MLTIVAEVARAASRRTQVVFTTHSPEFLDAFGDEPPTTTVVELADGESQLRNVEGEELEYWINKKYRLGAMFRSGQLESMP